MKKNPKENNKQKNAGKQLKDFIPATYTHLRECNPVVPPTHCDRSYEPCKYPKEIPKEWNETDAKEVISKSNEGGDVYADLQCMEIILPHSLYHNYLNDEVKWTRPEEYIKEALLDKEIIARYPNKNKFKFKTKLMELHAEYKAKEASSLREYGGYQNNNEDDYYTGANTYYLYRDLFKIIEAKPEIRIVNHYTREETAEEYEERIRKEREDEEMQQQQLAIKMKKDPKTIKKKTKPDETITVIEKKRKNILSPSNISMKNGYPPFCRWLASIYQMIKDRNIVDVNTGESIWQKIYPQEDNVPIYNPKGLYIVKLYYMGKLRQIEIDDTMPCSRYNEFYLPKCDMLNELWPAILTKAIIKLYSHTFISSSYKECGDFAPFYSLTGLIPQTLSYDPIDYGMISDSDDNDNDGNEREDERKDKIEVIKQALTDDSYAKGKQFIMCYRKGANADNEKNEEDAANRGFGSNENEFIPQKRFFKKENQPQSSSSKKIDLLIQYKRKSTLGLKSTASLVELKRMKNMNQLPSTMARVVDEIDNNTPFKKMVLMKKKKTTIFYNKKNRLGSGKSNKSNGDKDNDDEVNKDNEQDKDDNDNDDKMFNGNFYQSSLKQGIEKFENKIYVGVLYDVIDYFDNKDYNMNKLKPIDFSDLKDMVKQLNTIYVFKQLLKEEKKIYIEKLKEIKIKQKSERARRIEELQMKGVNYQSIKIGNNSIEDPKLFITFTDEEIEMTKKCLLNNWEFPPVEYIDKVYEERTVFNHNIKPIIPMIMGSASKLNIHPSGGEPIKGILPSAHGNKITSPKKSVKFGSFAPIITEFNCETTPKGNNDKKKTITPIETVNTIMTPVYSEENITYEFNSNNKNLSNDSPAKKTTWNREVYFQLINNNTEQYLNGKEPISREKGTWVEHSDFFKCFNSFLLLTNPHMYHTCFDWDNNWYDTTDFISVDKSKRVLHLFIDEPSSSSISPYMIMMFSANGDKTNCYRNVPYSISFSLIQKNKDTHSISASKRISLKSFLDTKQIKLDPLKEYFLLTEGGLFPSGFFFRLLTDFTAESLYYSQYLTQHRNYQKITYKVEHATLEKNQPYMLLRLLIEINETSEIVIVSNQKDSYASEFTQCYLINNKTMNKRKVLIEESIRIEYNSEESTSEGNEYLIVMTTTPPFNLSEEPYDIDILYDKPSTVITIIENIPSYDISDFYLPNKHKCLFQDFIFAGEKVYSMLYIKLRKLIKEDTDQEPPTNPIKTKDKQAIQVNQYKEEELDEKLRIILHIYNKDSSLLKAYDFYNEITIHNVTFEGTVIAESKNNKPNKNAKEESPSATNTPYLIKCFLDTAKLPNWFMCYDFIKDINWLIRVFSSDTLGFCKDTTKEDMERNMINAWETVEPGRSDKAKLSRRRFILEKKKSLGKELNEEDSTFISTPRTKKIFLPMITAVTTEPNKTNKKDEGKPTKKKTIKESKINLTIQEKSTTELNMNKPQPRIEMHTSLYARNYLSYVYNERLIKYDHNYTQKEKLLNNELLAKEKSERITTIYDNSFRATQHSEDDIFKTQLGDQTKRIYQKACVIRKEDEKSLMPIMKRREDIIAQITARRDTENRLNDLLIMIQSDNGKEDPKGKNKFDINACVQSYNDITSTGHQSELAIAVHTAISMKKEEIIRLQLKKIVNGKEKEYKQTALQHLNDIIGNKWTIPSEIITRLELLSK